MANRCFLLLTTLIFIFIYGCSKEPQVEKESNLQIVSSLEKLTSESDYFRLKEEFDLHKDDLSVKDSLYYNAIIDHIFSNPGNSNRAINALLNNPSYTLADSGAKNLYSIKLVNHINLYEYEMAADAGSHILHEYFSYLDSAELSEYSNTQKMWNALRNVPKQEVKRNKDFTIPMVRDKIGLFNIDVAIGDSVMNFVFDTGANFSTMQRSYAEKLGLKLIDADVDVAAATGKMVKGDLAVADSVVIGGLTFTNVVFLVFDDDALTFPQINYGIKGIIGFPVIKAMEEVHITKDNMLFIPRELTKYSYNNFALSGFIPTVAVFYKGDTLRFHFDTGAARTSLYPLFYEKYRAFIEQNYRKEIFTTTSAGGPVESEGYIISDLIFSIADSHAELDSLKLPLNFKRVEQYHGNLGQDYIKQFDEMIISFKYSSICFKQNSITMNK